MANLTRDYWSKTLQRRITRRRALAVAAAGAGAAALAACGGDDDKGAQSRDTSSLITQLSDTTKDAVPGGIWQSFIVADPLSFDPITGPRGTTFATYYYSRLTKHKAGTPQNPANGDIEGDGAESWEIAPDGSQITFKLRPNLKLDPRPPTNGRLLTAEDAVFSWNTYVDLNPFGYTLAAKKVPGNPFGDWVATDSRTLVVKLTYPYAPALKALTDFLKNVVIVPREWDGKFDPKLEPRGSGPFMLTKWTPSVKVEYRRNPNYYEAGRPFLEGVDQTLITEYAQRMAQFRAGNLWTLNIAVVPQIGIRQEDVLPLKKEVPKLILSKNPMFPVRPPNHVFFSQRPDSPFKDLRVRKAFSMLIDRSQLMELIYNFAKFEQEGIELNSRLDTIVPGAYERFWLNPLDKSFGDTAKNLEPNATEATALLKAAGASSIEFPYYTSFVNPQTQAFVEMLNSSGVFKVRIVTVDANEYRGTNYTLNPGLFDGVLYLLPGSPTDPDTGADMHAPGSSFFKFQAPLPYNDLLEKQRREFDSNKRVALWHDIQRRWAEDVSNVVGPSPGWAQELFLHQPYFMNFNTFLAFIDLGMAAETWTHFWYDKSKA